MKMDELVTLVFYAIFGYLVLTNASAFNSIIQSGGGFITTNIALLQGRQIVSGGLLNSSPVQNFR